jgi:metal-responsive CopG/Arc/MetJ family transcriptional regulator
MAIDKVVKIDSKLLDEVEAFITSHENKFRYVNRKQFIDVAVSEFLRKEKRKVKK